jgi:VWFA-related protein
MEEKLTICRSAIRSFVNDLDSRDDIFLFAFSESAYPLAPPTTDQATLLSNLSRLHAFGRTAIYDSINEGLSMLSKGCYPTKALFLITDGMDNSSSNHLETIVTRASKANVPIYSIGIGNHAASGSFFGFRVSNDSEAVDTKALSTLANDTGGQTFLVTLADKGEALTQTASTIADKINNRYIVGFVGDGSTNQLHFEAPGHKGFKFKILTQD